MRPYFNTSGPCIPGDHYMLPPERRLGRVMQLIEDQRYFTLHAGRQTGKTTCAFWILDHLNAQGQFRAVYVDLETAREKPDPAKSFLRILGECDHALSSGLPRLARPTPQARASLLDDVDSSLQRYWSAVAAQSDRPLVVLFDEVDGLVGPSMVSFLTQLRAGYIARSRTPFPASIVLIGQRQVRDYPLSLEERRAVSWLGTTSPFNITAEATTLEVFTRAEVEELLLQHTQRTGQRFEPEAIDRIQTLSCGHPWLVNALAHETVSVDVQDRSIPITAAHVEVAKERIIIERRSHIDSLVSRLREERIRRVLDPMLAGDLPAADTLDDDLSYCAGLGLIVASGGAAKIANPIYREVIPRALTYARQMTLGQQQPARFIRGDGRLDMDALLAEFQQFWRKDGHLAAEGFGYRESGPHLMLMAFLQRIVNGGGRIEREYGLGRGALDLLVEWQGERHAIEVKLRRDSHTQQDALDQITGYLEHVGLEAGYLVLFDLRKRRSWAQKLTRKEIDHRGKRVHLIGC